MTRPVLAHKANDGELFENEVDSKLHDINTKFKTWYEEKEGENGKSPNGLYYNCISRSWPLDADKIIDWILLHNLEVSNFIKEYNERNDK